MLRITNVTKKKVDELKESHIKCEIIPIDTPETPDMEYTLEFKGGILRCYPDDGSIVIDYCGRIVILESGDYRSLEMI